MVVTDVVFGGHPLEQRPALGVVGRIVQLDRVLGPRLEAALDVAVVEVVLAARRRLRRTDRLPRLVVQVDGGARHRALARQLEAAALRVVPDPVADLQRCLVAEHFEVAHRGALAERRDLPDGVEAQASVGLAVALLEGRAVAEGHAVGVVARRRDGVLGLRERHSGVQGVVVADAVVVEEPGAPGRGPAAVVGVQHVGAVHRAGLVEVTAGQDVGRRAGRRSGRRLVAEAVPEGEQHRAVGLERDLGQRRLGVGHVAGAGTAVLRGREGVLPREPAGAGAGAADRAAARVVERLVQHGVLEHAGGGVEGQHHGPQVRGPAGRLAGADTAEVAGAVLQAEAVRTPVPGGRAARVGDRVGGLGLGGRRRCGVVAVELAVVEVDDEQVLAVVADLDAAQALLAHRGQEGVVVARAVRRAAGVRDGGEQGGLLLRGVGHVDRARTAGAVRGGALGRGRGEEPLVGPVPRDAVEVAGLLGGGQIGHGRVGTGHAPGTVREGGQRVRRFAFPGRGLTGRHQRRVLLAVVTRAPQPGGDLRLLAAGEVDELLVAAQLVGRTGQALARGEGREQHTRLRIHHLDAVLAAGHLARRRRQRHRAVRRRGALDPGARVVGERHLHARHARFQCGRPHPAGVHGPDHPDRHRPVAGLREGRRGRRQRAGADRDGQRHRPAERAAAEVTRPPPGRAARGAGRSFTCRRHPCSHRHVGHFPVGPADRPREGVREWRKAAIVNGSLKRHHTSSQENKEL